MKSHAKSPLMKQAWDRFQGKLQRIEKKLLETGKQTESEHASKKMEELRKMIGRV